MYNSINTRRERQRDRDAENSIRLLVDMLIDRRNGLHRTDLGFALKELLVPSTTWRQSTAGVFGTAMAINVTEFGTKRQAEYGRAVDPMTHSRDS